MKDEDLHPETFYDIRDDAGWAILRMMPQLILVYSLSIGILGTVVFVILAAEIHNFVGDYGIGQVFLLSAGCGILLAIIHAFIAYRRPLDKFTNKLGGEPLDPEDQYHKTFKNVVEEITLAAPVTYVSARVIPTPRTNILAAGDRDVAEILITEGALGQLTRAELQAAVAHERAHIAYGDARLKLFTSNILEIFEIFNLEKFSRMTGRRRGRMHLRVRGKGGAIILVLALLSPLLKGLNRIFATGISVQREWRADATAVEYCRNPLALAGALYKLGRLKPKSMPVGSPGPVQDYKESVTTPAYSQLLFVPFDSANEETHEISWWEKLFLTHPPLPNRIDKALNMAGVPYSDLKRRVEKERSSPNLQLRPRRDKDGNPLFQQSWWVFSDGEQREVKPGELLTGGILSEDKLIAQQGDEEWNKPEEHSRFKALKHSYEGEDKEGECPRCSAPLCWRFYMGVPIKVCLLCGGVALSWRKVIRLETRHRDGKIPDRLGEIEDYNGYHGGEPIDEDKVTGGECPKCEVPFRAKRYHATKLIVDQCPSCHLTWFQEDELVIALNL